MTRALWPLANVPGLYRMYRGWGAGPLSAAWHALDTAILAWRYTRALDRMEQRGEL